MPSKVYSGHMSSKHVHCTHGKKKAEDASDITSADLPRLNQTNAQLKKKEKFKSHSASRSTNARRRDAIFSMYVHWNYGFLEKKKHSKHSIRAQGI